MNAPTVTRVARCACADCSLTVSGDPRYCAICHCANCRRRTGSAFGMSAYFSKAQLIQTTGPLTRYAFHHPAQDHDQERFFCARCGTTLYWLISTQPDLIGIAGGCFTDPPLDAPQRSHSHSQKLPWVLLPADLACQG